MVIVDLNFYDFVTSKKVRIGTVKNVLLRHDFHITFKSNHCKLSTS